VKADLLISCVLRFNEKKLKTEKTTKKRNDSGEAALKLSKFGKYLLFDVAAILKLKCFSEADMFYNF
jgi:hypothetical protein